MANISSIKLPDDSIYQLKDNGALQLTGGQVTGPVNFGDSVYISDLNAGTLIVTGNAAFTNNIRANTINGVEVGSNPKFTDTTYTFDGTYNASTNKAATVNTVTNAINNLDGNLNNTAPGVGKTLTSFSQTNGKVSATFGDISITKSQVSDFPTSMPASDVPAWAKEAVKPSYHLDEVQPLFTKTYTGIIATANDAAHAWFFFGSIRPTSWQAVWSIRYRIKGDVPNQVGYDQQAEVTISGSYDVLRTYASYNKVNASLSAYYHELYRLKKAGFNSGYGHLLGVRLQSSTNPTNTSYKRTFNIEILELKNCTFTFFDNFKLYNTTDISWSGTTNYTGYSEINYCSNGLQEVGDAYDANYYNRENYASRTTSAALYRYQLCLTKSDGTLVPINSVNNSIATNKTLTMDSFDPFGEIFYWNSQSTASANANVGNSVLYRQYLCDLRYSFNCGGYNVASTLIARKPLYLVAVPQDDGTAELYAEPLSMQLPSSVDNLIYIYLGRVYEDTYPYKLVLSLNHPIYEYRDGAVRLYNGLKSKAAASGGTDVSLVTTGEKYLWNSKTNNTGTVTSVAAAAASNSGITISGSPITSTGTITIGLNLSNAINGLGEGTAAANRDNYIVAQHTNGNATYHRRKLSNIFAALNSTDITNALGGNKSANVVFAGPSSGNAATPSFRALVEADIPGLAWSKITSGNDDLKAIEALTGTSGLLKKTAANAWTLDTSTYLTGITSSQVTSALGFTPYNATNPNGYTSNTGTVTSVRVQADAPLQSSTNTAQTSTLNTTISFVKQNANVVLAGPSSGSTTASPTFRALVEADIPSLSKSKISDFPTSWALSNISGADDLKAIEALTGTTGFLKKTNTNTWSLDTNTYLTATTLPAASTSTAGITKVGASGGAAAYDHVHGHLKNAGTITTTATIDSGDRLVIVDSNDSSKINGSSITFGSDQTKFLTNKGTWVVPTGTYSLPTATSSTLGGIKIGYTETGKNYPVELSNGQAYVNVPWTDNNTTYSAGTGLSLSGTTFNHSNSIAAGTAGTSSNTSSSDRTISIPYITYDAQGHITGSGTHTHTLSSFPEAYLSWGGASFNSSYGCIDAAMVPELGANRFAFLKSAGIEIDYSTDDGTTWNDYGETDDNKTALFARGRAFYLGKATTKTNNKINNQLRVTITTNLANVYTVLNKIAIYMSTNGNNTYVKIEKATKGDPTTYVTHSITGADSEGWIGIGGWSGWNILNMSGITTYGNRDDQYQKIRFIFKQTSVNSNYPSPGISRIMGFGGVGWTTPSNMAYNGHLYSYDSNQNAAFPAQVTATQFNGNATSASSLTNKTLDSSTIDRIAGSFTFQGNAAPWAGTDWVGLQVDSGSDKFQIHALNSTTLQYRQNDSGGTNSNWNDWQSLLSSGNYTDYTVTKSGTGASGTWGINISGTAATASEISAITSSDNASNSDVWRNVWISYSNNTKGRPAVTSDLAYQTSSKTLKASHFLAEHISKGEKEFQVKYGSTIDMALMVGSSNKNHGLYDYIAGKWMIFADENHNVTVNGNATSANKANITTTANAIAYYSDTTGTFASKASANGALYATSNNGVLTWGTLPVAQGGTGKSSFIANSLIMSGTTTTAALTTRAISTTITADDSTKIPTEGAVKTYIDNQIATLQDTVQDGYVTIAGNAQQVTGRKTFSNLAGASFKPAEGSESCNISYNQSLGALVFSFG